MDNVLNINKYKVLHIGKNNTKGNYEIGCKIVDSLEEELNLGDILSSDLKAVK